MKADKYILLFFSSLTLLGCVHLRAADKSQSDYYWPLLQPWKVVTAYNGNFFELGSEDVEGADPLTFKVLGNNYAKDRSQVYFGHSILPGADPKSFEVEGCYAKDAQQVFYWNQPLAKADPVTFHGIVSPVKKPMRSKCFGRDHAHVFRMDSIIEQAEPKTFEILNEFWSRDARHVYFYDRLVQDADAGSFRADDFSANAPNERPHDARDKNQIYCHPQNDKHEITFEDLIRIPQTSPSSFEYAGSTRYRYFAKDEKNLYMDCVALPGIDPVSFEILTQFWLKDRNGIYTEDGIRADVVKDSQSFQPIEDKPFGQDKEFIYWYLFWDKKVIRIPQTVPPSFEPLQDPDWAKDRDHVYYEGELIPEADPKSFRIFKSSPLYARDSNHYYSMGKKIDEKPSWLKED